MLKLQLPSQQCYEIKFHQPSSLEQLTALKNALGKIKASACYHVSANGYLRSGGGKKMRSQRTRNRGHESEQGRRSRGLLTSDSSWREVKRNRLCWKPTQDGPEILSKDSLVPAHPPTRPFPGTLNQDQRDPSSHQRLLTALSDLWVRSSLRSVFIKTPHRRPHLAVVEVCWAQVLGPQRACSPAQMATSSVRALIWLLRNCGLQFC